MRRFITAFVLGILCLPAFAQSGVFFSEYVEGSSNNKALEIYNATPAAVNLAGYAVKMYFNGSSSAGLTIALSGSLAPGATYVLVQSAADPVLIAKANLTNGSGWFNGDDAVVLVNASGAVVDAIGQVGVDPGSEWGSGLTSTADNTLRRKTTITTGDTNATDAFNPSVEWDGYANNTFDGIGSHGVAPPTPPAVTAEIFEIQGSGAASPFAGQTVQTFDNVVTAVGPQGFFIQTPDYRADASASTSNAVYVFTSTAPAIAVGDLVDVKGQVVEYFNMTEFSGGVTYTVDAHGQTLPAVFELTAGYSDFEPLENMLVRLENGTAADGTNKYGETMVVAAPTRPFRAAGINGGDHPEILDVDPTAMGAAAPSIVGGAAITLAEGPLAFSFGRYSIWTTTLQYANPAYPRGARARVAGELTVAGQNMLRLFDDRNDPTIGEPVTNPAVYAARLEKISSHVRNVLGSPDVLAVSEVENLITLQDLASKINADDATLNYTAYLLEGHDIGGIDVGFLVRDTVSVDSVQQLGADDTWVDPNTGDESPLNDRPPLLLLGSYVANGTPFPIGVVAVHQRSLIDVETSARVRAKREAQALHLAGYINDVQTAHPGARLVVTGDFNAFEFNDGYVDVLGIITSSASLTNQVLSVPADDRYSYVEEGVAQVLDHSLTSAPLNPFVRELQFAHANADAPELTSPASDHDGVVLFVMSDHDGDGLADDDDECPTGDTRATVNLAGCETGAPNIAFEGGCTLADKLGELHSAAKNHGQFVSEASRLLNELMKSGQLTGEQKGAIESCAAQWSNKPW